MTRLVRTDHDRFVGLLVGPAEPELTCEECFEQLDRYVDLAAARADIDAAVPGMRAHLEGCPACREDHESLALFVAGAAAVSSPGLRS
ncbi:MAG: hypothetical protein IT294_12275 [Deltaproteobacteria bacterium]|nr:hypothetical protein [Deltaproteobacteria bacterium]